MSPAQIAELDKTFRAWAAFAPAPQRGRCVNTVRCPIPQGAGGGSHGSVTLSSRWSPALRFRPSYRTTTSRCLTAA